MHITTADQMLKIMPLEDFSEAMACQWEQDSGLNGQPR
jgi:hypothetical protein